jgi:hypothetical protein
MRRECLDHVIVLHEQHLRRLLTGYLHGVSANRLHGFGRFNLQNLMFCLVGDM